MADYGAQMTAALTRPWDPANDKTNQMLSIGDYYGGKGRNDALRSKYVPDGFRALTVRAPDKWSSNQNEVLSSLYNPSNQVRDAKGNLLTGAPTGSPYGTYYVPYKTYKNIVQPNFIDQGSGLLGTLGSLALGVGGSLLLPGLGTALGGGLLGSAGAGAIVGGATSGLTGGNILKGAALGGLGGGLSNYVGSNFSSNPSSGVAGISPAQFASTAGKTGLNMLAGQNPTQALLGGAGSLAGTSAASNFSNPWLKNLAGSTVSAGIQGGNVGTAGLNSLLGTTARFGASQTDNPWLKDLALSSPKLLGSLLNQQQRPQQPRPQPQQAAQQGQAQMPDWVRQAMVALGKKGYTEEQAKQMIQQRGRG
jgi:hypothetical protein